MIWQRVQRVQSGIFSFIPKRLPRQGLGFFSRSCTNLLEPNGSTMLRNPEFVLDDPTNRAGQNIFHSLVGVSFHGPNDETNKFLGVIVDSDGTIITSSSVAVFDYKVARYDSMIDVHLYPNFGVNNGISACCTFSGVLSLLDFTEKIAIVRCNTDHPLSAARLGNPHNLNTRQTLVSLRADFTEHGNAPSRILNDPAVITGFSGFQKSHFNLEKTLNHGVLVNDNGELVGMGRFFKGLSVQLIVEMVKFAKKYVEPALPWLGMELKFLDKTEHRPFNKGCLVCKVEYGSPAHHAGICEGDVLLKFDGHNFSHKLELLDFLYFKSGEDLEVTLNRIYVSRSLKVTLRPSGKMPSEFVPWDSSLSM